ncbi:uncharacterized protein B4U79_03101 [Dinothrombium tinctorium]|uniref:Sodium/potassium-transporting ATPase subunit beta-1-interacting protein n=1 Tax=Dinothrombium tinctorium TaxID=1965070 RepID=A0A3S3RJQ6_9ACAR|nr:uncharacterized protein B4U79_11821 [Dinothrombium tinctorium]RWS08111.1 uncharacterized protein B4U79_03101 [Dinothrombium tinctorium]
MGTQCLKAKCSLLFLCFLQLLFTIVRQVFDFLGQVWTSILFNFFSILITIVGCFGGFESRNCYLYVYCFWQILSFLWNLFVVCFYLEIGSLFDRDKDENVLNLGTGSRSWFESNGPLCEPIFNESHPVSSHQTFIRPIHVKGCVLYYFVIESIQATIQIVLSIFAFISSFFLIYYNSHESTVGTDHRRRMPPTTALPAYSISQSMRQSMRRSNNELENESLPSFYDINQYNVKSSSRNSLKSSKNSNRNLSSHLYINTQML